MSALLTVEEAAPGDVDAVRVLGHQLRDTAEDARQARTELHSIGGSCRALPWEGMTAEAFRGMVEQLPLDVERLATGYEQVSVALLTYAATLAGLKERAGEHVRSGQQALTRLAALRVRRMSLQASLNSAVWSLRRAQSAQAGARIDDSPAGAAASVQADREVAAAQNHLRNLERDIAAVGRDLSAEQSALQRAKQGLEDVRDDARAAGRTAAGLVREAADNSWRDRGLLGTVASLFDAAGVQVGLAAFMAITKALLGKDALAFVTAVVKRADDLEDVTKKFLARRPEIITKALSKLKAPARLLGAASRVTSVLGRIAWPLTVFSGFKDLITGGGYDGWRGTVTRVLGGVAVAGGLVLGAAAIFGAAALGVVGSPVVLAGAAIAVTAYGLWSAGNAVVDNWDTIRGWGESAAGGVQRAYDSATSRLADAGEGIAKRALSIGRGFSSPLPLRGIRVF